MALSTPSLAAQVRSMGGAIILALGIRCFFGEIFQIPSGSMIPTLAVGDRIMVNKLAYGPRVPFTARRLWAWAAPARGEVVVFIAPMPPHEDYIKRIVGLAGDQVEVRDGQAWVNGKQLARRPGVAHVYRDRDNAGVWRDLVAVQSCEMSDAHAYSVLADVSMPQGAFDMAPQTVPSGHVFVMGDNRNHSADSRVWGFVPHGALLGRAVRVFFSWGEHGLSWRRTGNSVHHGPSDCPQASAPLAAATQRS